MAFLGTRIVNTIPYYASALWYVEMVVKAVNGLPFYAPLHAPNG